MSYPFSDSTDVPNAGTRVQISNTPRPVQSITFKARSGNTGNTYVGDVSVAAAAGFELLPGEELTFTARPGETFLLSDFYVDAATNGDDVDWIVILEAL